MAEFITRFILFALVHSLLAGSRCKEIIRHLTGRWYRGYRLTYNLLSIILFGWVMVAWRDSPMLYRVPSPWNWALYDVQTLAALLLVRCAAQLGVGDFLGLDQLRGLFAPARLVTDGCYGRVRHPQYLLAIIFLAANPVMTAMWATLAFGSAVYLALGAWIEERRMGAAVGEDYAVYRKQVPCIFPRWKK